MGLLCTDWLFYLSFWVQNATLRLVLLLLSEKNIDIKKAGKGRGRGQSHGQPRHSHEEHAHPMDVQRALAAAEYHRNFRHRPHPQSHAHHPHPLHSQQQFLPHHHPQQHPAHHQPLQHPPHQQPRRNEFARQHSQPAPDLSQPLRQATPQRAISDPAHRAGMPQFSQCLRNRKFVLTGFPKVVNWYTKQSSARLALTD